MIKRIIRSFSLFISTLILMLSTFGTPALANGQEAGFLSEQDQEILQQYHDGNTESGLERRREIIEQNGLEAYVDEDGFLTGRFYDTHDLFAITRSHLVLIDRTQKAEYRSRLDELLKSGTTYQSVRALSVAGLSEVTAIWGPGRFPTACGNCPITSLPSVPTDGLLRRTQGPQRAILSL